MIITLIIVLLFVIAGVLCVRVERRARAKKLANAFANREALSIVAFYHRYYNATDIPYPVVAGVVKILEEHLDADLSRLRVDDDFSKNLSFFWDYDSMADVEIVCALEKEFN